MKFILTATVKLLLSRKADVNLTDAGHNAALHHVIHRRCTSEDSVGIPILSVLLQARAEIDKQGKRGGTALYYASRFIYVTLGCSKPRLLQPQEEFKYSKLV